ncbi:hypothetical protein EJ05DRAFT_496369 [Pseudovirgaria hyperparasitica]|uniref:Uncharacterized protein n=1 Tax=Pseudovirgaria hyperparasitica TaxID=470096 RepID=A0A6A6WN42_9PEZI|nr:uncharacterized protein EJ05DRAFT_496369 [Pseudovirgaria hyperparasitica]KAF2763553.1 hypothetical protein EJ05DRAFT_496369 [Pseudovirgaria hyperparasitica]
MDYKGSSLLLSCNLSASAFTGERVLGEEKGVWMAANRAVRAKGRPMTRATAAAAGRRNDQACSAGDPRRWDDAGVMIYGKRRASIWLEMKGEKDGQDPRKRVNTKGEWNMCESDEQQSISYKGSKVESKFGFPRHTRQGQLID